MLVLGLETSCDETSAALVEDGKVLANIIKTQIDIHRLYGGVVPEIASRNHLTAFLQAISLALEQAKKTLEDVDAIAATVGPGLIGALLVGSNAGKGLALSLDLPFYGVNHLEGHLLSPLVENKVAFPYLALLVSGGNTALYVIERIGSYRLLGSTLDDAAGEAYDKVALLMGLGYPGGKVIDDLAKQGRADAYAFPRPLLRSGNFDFSFSGLKTAVSQQVKRLGPAMSDAVKADLAASFQAAVIDVLAIKTLAAAAAEQVSTLCICGGVAANSGLRNRLAAEADKLGYSLHVPSHILCTDNAGMVAFAGYQYLRLGMRNSLRLPTRAASLPGPS